MKLNEMNVVITGANGGVATVLMDYFSSRVAFVVGTARQLAKSVDKNNSETEGNNDTESVSEFSPPRQDEDAMRSEIRSLRQTAVSLTVGEKEGASALIKEWLEDNPNKKEDDEAGD